MKSAMQVLFFNNYVPYLRFSLGLSVLFKMHKRKLVLSVRFFGSHSFLNVCLSCEGKTGNCMQNWQIPDVSFPVASLFAYFVGAQYFV